MVHLHTFAHTGCTATDEQRPFDWNEYFQS